MAIIAAFKQGQTKVYTRSAHQFDKGQKLIVTGVALPERFEVHIANSKDYGIASAYVGSLEGVYIPDAYFVSGDYVYVWIYAQEEEVEPGAYDYRMGEDNTLEQVESGSKTVVEGTTIYEIIIPVIRRPVQLPVSDGGDSTIGYTVDDDHTLIPVRQ